MRARTGVLALSSAGLDPHRPARSEAWPAVFDGEPLERLPSTGVRNPWPRLPVWTGGWGRSSRRESVGDSGFRRLADGTPVIRRYESGYRRGGRSGGHGVPSSEEQCQVVRSKEFPVPGGAVSSEGNRCSLRRARYIAAVGPSGMGLAQPAMASLSALLDVTAGLVLHGRYSSELVLQFNRLGLDEFRTRTLRLLDDAEARQPDERTRLTVISALE